MSLFKDGPPPATEGRWIVVFPGGLVCSARYRAGVAREPQRSVVAWRSDCSGLFSTPIQHAKYDDYVKF